jgi:hypothetical protein
VGEGFAREVTKYQGVIPSFPGADRSFKESSFCLTS